MHTVYLAVYIQNVRRTNGFLYSNVHIYTILGPGRFKPITMRDCDTGALVPKPVSKSIDTLGLKLICMNKKKRFQMKKPHKYASE